MVAVLFNAGDHVPVILLSEVVGKAVKLSPVQIEATCVNVGVIIGFTIIVIVADAAHCPSSGVKVYVVVTVLSKAGLQLPVTPLVEVVGKGFKVSP